jgi:hypothetical protein
VGAVLEPGLAVRELDELLLGGAKAPVGDLGLQLK